MHKIYQLLEPNKEKEYVQYKSYKLWYKAFVSIYERLKKRTLVNVGTRNQKCNM